MNDLDFDLDALLDDIASEVTDLAYETPLDKHDRLHQAFLDAREAAQDATRALERAEEETANALGHTWHFYDSIVRPEMRERACSGVYRPNRDTVMPLALEGIDIFVPEVTQEMADRLIDAYREHRRACEEEVESQRSYLACYEEVKHSYVEGAYVRFEDANVDQWGYVSSTYNGYGTITKITAASYIVEINHHASSHRYEGKETVRIKVEKATTPARNGGRGMVVIWGPTGNARRAERDRLAAIKRAEESRRADAAYAKMREAIAAYDAAKRADDEHRTATRVAPERAAMEAAQRILARYADEVKAEADAILAEALAAMPAYERSPLLDGPPPSRNWSDYLEEE